MRSKGSFTVDFDLRTALRFIYDVPSGVKANRSEPSTKPCKWEQGLTSKFIPMLCACYRSVLSQDVYISREYNITVDSICKNKQLTLNVYTSVCCASGGSIVELILYLFLRIFNILLNECNNYTNVNTWKTNSSLSKWYKRALAC